MNMNEKFEGKSSLITFQRGDIIFKEGDAEKVLYKILTGKVKIYVSYGTQQQREIAVLEKEQCFGVMSILENTVRSATAVAEEETFLMCYRVEALSLFAAQNTSFVLELLKSLSLRLRNTNQEVEEMYKLLQQYTEQPSVHKMSQIDLYLRQHTVFDQDGTPYYTISR